MGIDGVAPSGSLASVPSPEGTAERAENEDVSSRLLDHAPDALVVVDGQGRIVLANLQTERMFGYPRSELLEREIEVLIPERFRGGHVGLRRAFLGAPAVRPMGSGLELFGRKRDGTEFPLEISLSPLETRRGLLVSANIRDISDRKKAEKKVSVLQAHLLNAVESIQGMFAIFDADDVLVLCNSDFRLGLARDIEGEIVGLRFDALLERILEAGVFELDGEARQAFRTRWISQHREPSSPLEVTGQSGRRLRIVERRTTDGGLVTTIWDVTDEVERETELRRARAEAEAASSAKSEFLASMSHELRTPLNAILGFAQLLQRDKKTPLSERHAERVGHIVRGGEHLLRLIDEVLDLSRVEAGQLSVSLEAVGVSEIVEEVVTTLASLAAAAEVEISRTLPPDLPEVLADRTRLRQVLMNFGTNAIKYGRPQGKVGFSARLSGRSVRVTVSDNGIGIPAAKQGKLFQPFHRAGQETGPIEGTGIGLALSKRLADLMHGTIGFRSVEGAGSDFWLELPAQRPAAVHDAAERSSPFVPRAQQEPLAAARALVLYVEDNPSNISFMEHLMSDYERVELVTARTAEAGIELARTRRPKLVIMDINLPGMSGIEAVRRLRAFPDTADIPVVGLSAAVMTEDKERVVGAGFERFLTKPMKLEELDRVLEELLE